MAVEIGGMASLTLGSLQLKSKVILAPLERVSDVGFRRLCFQQGASLTWTEMVYASDFSRGVSTAVDLVDTHDCETLTGLQLLIDRTSSKDGWGVDTLKRALDKLEEGAATDRPEWRNIRAIDLNFGCPSPSISKRGAGPAQLRRRSKVRTIFETLGDWRKSTSLPMIGAVGAKIRLGANAREQEYKVYLPVAQAAIGCLDYLVVHARHAKERSRDPPTWEAIAVIEQSIEPSCSLPIIGNGNIRTAADMARITELTGCDGVMVGREAMRNPWALRSLVNGKEDDGYSDKQILPSVEQLEFAIAEYTAWSSCRPAASRYKLFHEDNFERLRSECADHATQARRQTQELATA